MAKIFGHDSEYIRRLRRNFFIKWLLLLLAALATVVLMVSSLRLLRTHAVLDVLLIIAILFVVLSLVFRWRDVEEDGFISAFRGLRGEDDICKLLQQLPDTYSVFRGLQFREHNDTDFVVVGPTGVFTIEVKSHRGVIGYDGHRLTNNHRSFREKNFLSQAMSEAMDVHAFLREKTGLEAFVVPAIVFSSPRARVHFGKERLKGVYVIQKDWLLPLLQKYEHKEPLLNIELIGKVLAMAVPQIKQS